MKVLSVINLLHGEIQTKIRENPNKKQFFYYLDIAHFMFIFPGF
jgi:hypothetical protein